MAIDIDRFMPIERFSTLIGEYVRKVRSSTKARGRDRIYLPGEIEAERERLNKTRGVEVDPPVAKAIDRLLEERGLSLRLGDGELNT